MLFKVFLFSAPVFDSSCILQIFPNTLFGDTKRAIKVYHAFKLFTIIWIENWTFPALWMSSLSREIRLSQNECGIFLRHYHFVLAHLTSISKSISKHRLLSNIFEIRWLFYLSPIFICWPDWFLWTQDISLMNHWIKAPETFNSIFVLLLLKIKMKLSSQYFSRKVSGRHK